jgi:two-component system, NtrC family, nitrogen regulation sensor histidine kinase NtrY
MLYIITCRLKLTFNTILLGLSATFLVAALSMHLLVNRQAKDETGWVDEIQSHINSKIASLENDLMVLSNQLSEVGVCENVMNSVEGSIYVYKDGKLACWSDYRFAPEFKLVRDDFDIKFIRSIRRDFIAVQKKVGDFKVIGVLPIYTGYKIDNRYIASSFNTNIFSNQNLALVQPSNENQICYHEQCLFSIVFQPDYKSDEQGFRQVTFLFYMLAFITLLIFFYRLSLKVSRKKFTLGLSLLVGLVLSVRYLMITFSIPKQLINIDVLDSRIFASSTLNSSFGDLLLNILLLVIICAFVFQRFHRSHIYRHILRWTALEKWLLSTLLLGLFIFMFHWLYLIFQTIYHNSQVTFDINETIKFDFIRVVSYTIYLLFSLTVFLIAHLSYRISKQLLKDNKWLIICFLGSAVLFGLINVLIGQVFIPSLIVVTILFAVLVITNLPASMDRLKYATFLYFFTVLLTTSILGAWAIYNFENERVVDKKKKFANQFLIENDHMAEFLLSEVNEKVKNDIFIQSRLASPFLSKDIIESKIRQVYLNSYFDKYDIKINLYNSAGKPINEGIQQPVEIKKLKVDEFKTGYDGIYFINKLEGNATKRYLNYIDIKKRGINVGFIIMDMRLKRIIPENVYPELLVDNRFLTPYENTNYSYAVYEGGKITYSSGDFNYGTNIPIRTFLNDAQNISYAGYKHVIIKDQAGRNIIISSNAHPFSDIISNFSFLFLLQVFVVLVLTAGYSLYYTYNRSGLNYSTRIQLYLNIAFFLPLFAVSITTLSLINATFEKEVNTEYYKKAESVGNNLSGILEDYVNDITDSEELGQKVMEIARFSGTDINVFNTKGKLMTTSQPAIYENGLLSEYANPVAFRHIIKAGDRAYTTNESVGLLKYNSTYFGVKSFDTGEQIGLVSIPFFQSEYALEQSQIAVVTSVINIFTMVFIVFLIISYFTAKWLTFPLAFITQKLRKTSLTEFNEPLTWNTDDEIGLMVGEYNKMLINLEESKRALARSEKQSAWREIAQQVAHEIKNPLTPMKLTLQHLSRKLLGSGEDIEKSRPVEMLLKQIDTLDDIASSFSSFAKMPIPESEKYEYAEVLRSTVNLHSATEGVTIDLQLPNKKVFTIGDAQLMGRILSNLILNAIQAKEGSTLQLNIKLSNTDNRLLLEVEDNGPGIDEDIQTKIFIPNFTTKETGSGIGLAIAKHGIEHAGGKIWFESKISKGTSFFIELPIIHE